MPSNPPYPDVRFQHHFRAISQQFLNIPLYTHKVKVSNYLKFIKKIIVKGIYNFFYFLSSPKSAALISASRLSNSFKKCVRPLVADTIRTVVPLSSRSSTCNPWRRSRRFLKPFKSSASKNCNNVRWPIDPIDSTRFNPLKN